MAAIELPQWAKEEECYKPSSDRDFFISRSLLRLMGILFRIRKQADYDTFTKETAAGQLLFVFVVILLVVGARTGVFLLTVLAGELVLLCRMSGEAIRVILRNAAAAMFFSALILLPALWIGRAPAVVLIPAKTFLTVVCLSLVTEKLPWHTLTASLRVFCLPQLFIQILDITLKYIMLLGEVSLQMLSALKLRSVGRNPEKKQAFSGVLGVTFLKSRELSQAMYEAMVCRGFTGEYPVRRQQCFHWKDGLLLLTAIGCIVFYFYVEGAFL